VSGLKKNLRLADDGRYYWHWDPALVSNSPEGESRAGFELLAAAANRVRIPTMLVRGLKSDIVSEAGIADLRTRIPQMEVCDVSGAGHMVAGDRNDAFNQCVFSFLRRELPPRRAG
jgi:pimeloyl-ACP methyl ester carboxylesterase